MSASSRAKDVQIGGLTADSREVRAGFLFAALPGVKLDGRRFISDAIGKGAAAILAPTGTEPPDIVVGRAKAERPFGFVTDDNPRRKLALMAARFYGAQPATVVAVTGTNGKSSVVSFTRQIWTLMGVAGASLGTLGLASPKATTSGSLTTPDPVALHRTLAELKAAGVEHMALEASSHGLAQYRLDGLALTAAAFTNLTRDHLDYHGDEESYFAAKARLFSGILPEGGIAVLNADEPRFEELRAICAQRRQRVIAFGEKGADIRLDILDVLPDGQRVSFAIAGEYAEVKLPLVGHFQAMNVACALGLVIAGSGAAKAALATLERLEGVSGRMQLAARHPAGAAVYVDYAHTPDALANVLGALRPHTRGRLLAVFGCGGDRDPGKRPQMGRIAGELADVVIVTDDNPRSEDPAAIRRQVLAGVSKNTPIEIADREEAIFAAVDMMESGDVLVLAGKGHEQGQIVGATTIPFNDVDEARKAVGRLGGTA
ncbi:MAG TPA: UDP-N-acetylmuramoyl-L-alanyl-D-glutamate--2,6-diaminopimelate ligase [Alphaproteobacteria bacterium]